MSNVLERIALKSLEREFPLIPATILLDTGREMPYLITEGREIWGENGLRLEPQPLPGKHPRVPKPPNHGRQGLPSALLQRALPPARHQLRLRPGQEWPWALGMDIIPLGTRAGISR